MTGLSHADNFLELRIWDPGSLPPPSWAHRARLEGEYGPHLESIRRAGRAKGPGPGLREGEGSQGAPHTSRAVSAGAEEGPGLAPSPAPPAAGFHPQIWPGVPLRRKSSLLNAGKTG